VFLYTEQILHKSYNKIIVVCFKIANINIRVITALSWNICSIFLS